MKVKWGALVVDGRGKIGGHVGSKNRAGAYFRTKVTPVNPNTSFQQAARARLSFFAQGWRDLTQAQRDAWNAAVSDFARTDIFGDVKNPTGFNLCVRLNTNILNAGGSQIDAPPLPAAVDEIVPGTLVINLTGSIGTLAFTPTVPTDMGVLLRATPSLSPGISFVKSELRIISVIAAATASPEDFFADYVAKFGAPVEGAKVFVSVQTVNLLTGQVSVEQKVDTIVLNA